MEIEKPKSALGKVVNAVGEVGGGIAGGAVAGPLGVAAGTFAGDVAGRKMGRELDGTALAAVTAPVLDPIVDGVEAIGDGIHNAVSGVFAGPESKAGPVPTGRQDIGDFALDDNKKKHVTVYSFTLPTKAKASGLEELQQGHTPARDTLGFEVLLAVHNSDQKDYVLFDHHKHRLAYVDKVGMAHLNSKGIAAAAGVNGKLALHDRLAVIAAAKSQTERPVVDGAAMKSQKPIRIKTTSAESGLDALDTNGNVIGDVKSGSVLDQITAALRDDKSHSRRFVDDKTGAVMGYIDGENHIRINKEGVQVAAHQNAKAAPAESRKLTAAVMCPAN
jgi:hypothetical protein